MQQSEQLPSPRLTATHLRQALATPVGVVVQDATTGRVFALPHGLTKPQALDETLVVVLTQREAAWYVEAAAGSYAAAARNATTVVRWEIEQIDARLAAWAGQ